MVIFRFFVRCPPLIEKLKPVSSESASYVQVSLTDLLFGTAFTVINFVTLEIGQVSKNLEKLIFKFISVYPLTGADYENDFVVECTPGGYYFSTREGKRSFAWQNV